MHSAGEGGGLERVFIKRLTNTNCVAEKRSTAANNVSYCMARFFVYYMSYFTRDSKNLDPYCAVPWWEGGLGWGCATSGGNNLEVEGEIAGLLGLSRLVGGGVGCTA